LFITLLLIKTDVYCAIDLDTILPNLLASMLRKKPRVYDAHELFCEMEEIVSRPGIQRIWKRIEMFAVPKFSHGYTIGACYANEFLRKYNVRYAIVRNATVLQPFQEVHKSETYILYQGAVNEGRCFENLIPAMKQVPTKLIVCGEGNFYKQAIELSLQHHTTHIEFKGYIPPSELRRFTQHASIGLTLFSNQGKSNYLSMANRFFDYMHDCIPQICVDFPEYKLVNETFEIAVLIPDTNPDTIANAINNLLNDKQYYTRLQQNCLRAREVYNWQEQEKTLLQVYKTIFE
jgi:glycosyltransferase involved in cell wall biosynthesis